MKQPFLKRFLFPENFKLVLSNAFAHGLNILVSLAFTIVTARLMTVYDFGELRTAMLILPLVMVFSLPGYDRTILRNSHMNKAIGLLRIFTLRFCFALLGSCLILAGILIFKECLSVSLRFFLLVMVILLPFFETGTGYRNYLIGMRLRDVALNLLLRTRLLSLLLLFVFFGLIYGMGLAPIALFPAYLLALIIPTLIAFFPVALREKRLRGDKNKNLRASWLSEEARQNLFSAIGMTLAGLAYTAAFSIDKLWLRHELGAAALASYSILVMVPQEGSRLFDAMIPLFYRTLFFTKDKKNKGRSLAAFAIVPFVAVAYVVSFYYLSPLIFGVAYHYDFISVALSGLLLCGISFEFFCSHNLFAKAGSRRLLTFTVTNLIVTLPVVYGSLALGGINGLMLGLFVKQIVVPAGFLMILRRRP
ncbi:MAG: hypothetical protein WC612_03690 [Bdellovibrionales bacterium]|jgi:O-antigen/teichoic acid export membrane protein